MLTGNGRGQSFELASAATINRTSFILNGASSPDGTLVSKLYENDGGLALPLPSVGTLIATSITSLSASVLTGSEVSYDFDFAPVDLAAGGYIVTVERVGDTTGTVRIVISAEATHRHPGVLLFTTNGGSSWGTDSDLNLDFSLESVEDAFRAGDLLRKRSDNDLYQIRDADPTNLFALAAEDFSGVLETGFVMVYELDPTHWYGMMGTRDPVSGDVDTAYGIKQNSDGHWIVDLSDTSNTRVTVKAVDTRQNYYYVVFDSNHIQS